MPSGLPDSQCSPKEYHSCECVKRSVLDEGLAVLEFLWPGPEPRAGQFFLVRPQTAPVFLGRPLSVAGWERGKVSFLLAVRGKGTAVLAETRPGEKAFLTGPLGRGWLEVSGAVGGQAALVSGGVGIAPLVPLAGELGGAPDSRPFDFYAGFRSRGFFLDRIRARSVIVSSEDGSEGNRGRIPDFLDPKKYAVVFACGPEPMLKAVAEKCGTAGVPCFISLERRMACGVGACLGCTVKTRNGNRRCCADGPVFNAEDIILD